MTHRTQIFYFQVDDIESKLDHLIELFEEDRRVRRIEGSSNNGGGGGSAEGGCGEVTLALRGRTRPALVDKQCSEPNSPVSRGYEPPAPSSAPPVPQKRPMNRGYSDLGTRFMKKRVIVK